MKKVIVLAMAAFLVTGVSLANDHKHDGKKCAKAKECSKEGKECCSKEAKKETKETKEAKKTETKKTTKA
ncbi:MAG: hypothetical protein IBJ16_05535 [Chitinophagaceae bacterium]|nr:hypothetical protein [Chitinophagaceae bacterium]